MGYEDSWVNQKLETHNCWDDAELTDFSTFEHYSYSIYWSIVTMATTGYGDVTAINTAEQWAACLLILASSCFFAYFLGSITIMVMEGDAVHSYVEDQLEAAQHFCDQKTLPPLMRQAILTHTKYHCRNNYVFDEEAVLEHL